MAETTRTPSGNPNQTASPQTASTSTSSGSTSPGSTSSGSTPSGGGRTGTTPSSTNPSSTAATSPAATTTPSSTAASRASATGATGNQGQRAQPQDQGQRPASQGQQRSQSQGQQSQGQQNQGSQNQGQRNQGQSTQGQSTQGQRQGEQGERGDEEYHVELSGDPMSDAKKVGSDLVGAARDSAMSLLDAQRARVADQITSLGDALRQSSGSLEGTGVGSLAQYATQLADQIGGFADSVRDRSWNELAGDLESFARRYPLSFMASAMGVGFMLGRFLLSSSERTAASMSSGANMSGVRTSEMRRDFGGTSRTVPSGARAEYGTSIRE